MFTIICTSFRAFHVLPVAAVAALAVAPAEGAITLTIDAEAKTFTWSGAETSSVFVVPDGTAVGVRLATNTSNNPTFNVNEGAGSLAVTGNYVPGSNAFSLPTPDPGRLKVGVSMDSLYTDLEAVFSSGPGVNGPGTSTMTLTLQADGVAYSYASLVEPLQAYLESLDGQDLFFYYNPGGVYQSFGQSAGTVTVVPEVSAVLLLAGAAPLVWMRRRRTGV